MDALASVLHSQASLVPSAGLARMSGICCGLASEPAGSRLHRLLANIAASAAREGGSCSPSLPKFDCPHHAILPYSHLLLSGALTNKICHSHLRLSPVHGLAPPAGQRAGCSSTSVSPIGRQAACRGACPSHLPPALLPQTCLRAWRGARRRQWGRLQLWQLLLWPSGPATLRRPPWRAPTPSTDSCWMRKVRKRRPRSCQLPPRPRYPPGHPRGRSCVLPR